MANRFWVDLLSSDWNGTAGLKWAASSGGLGGQTIPDNTTPTFFDGNSGSANVPITSLVSVLDLTCTGFLGTLSGSTFEIVIAGSFTLSTTMTWTYSGGLTFNATATGKAITFNGKVGAGVMSFTGVGGGWTFQDTINNGSSLISVSNGTLNTNDKTVTCGTFNSSNSNVRGVTLGSSIINCTTWTFTTTTNLTFNSGTSSIVWANGGAFNGGGLTYYDLTATITSAKNVVGNNTFHNFLNASTGSGIPTFTGNNAFASYNSNAGRTNKFTAGTIQTVDAMSVDGAAGNLTVIQAATAASFDLVSTGADIMMNYVSITNCHASGANFTAFNSVDGGGNSGITFATGPADISEIDGIPIGDIATINGIAIADIATIDGM